MLLYFNPGHETAVLNASPYYMPPANVLRMREDLAFLPAWYGADGDCVFISENADADYFSFLKQHFPHLPQPVFPEQLAGLSGTEVSLWGISPQAIRFFSELTQQTGNKLTLPDWHEKYSYLNSRMAARDFLEKLIGLIPGISSGLLPNVCDCMDEIKRMVQQSNRPLLAKTPYSSSGRGLLWLSVGKLPAKELEVLSGMLKKQRVVSLETVLEKATDFSMQFICDGRGNVQFEGYSLFETNERGAYAGTFLYSQEKINRILTDKIAPELLDAVKQALIVILKEQCAALYKGCVGIDMLIYKENGKYELHPCLEINMRCNMGYLSLKLRQNYLASSSEGKFTLDFHAERSAAYNKHIQAAQTHPPHISNGKVESGYFSLCPVSKQTKYRAYMIVNGI